MIALENVTKKFPNETIALQDVSFHIDPGEFVFIVGASGAGKTTILRLLLHELKPSSGTIHIEGEDIGTLKKNELPALRRKIGAVFQDYKLLDDHTARENVALVSEMIKASNQEVGAHVEEILSLVGLKDKEDLFPSQLSGGELQRTAIARALTTDPKIIFADEPTGNLDPASSWEIIKLLLKINEGGTTVIVATHNEEMVKALKKRIIELEKGRVIGDTKQAKAKKEEKVREKKSEEKEKQEEKQPSELKGKEKG